MKLMKIKYRVMSVVAVVICALYFTSAINRVRAHECVKKESRYGPYIGEYCYLPYRDGMLFRLYDAKTNRLLAERGYSDIEPRIVFSEDVVYYNMSASPEEYVSLPPTWLDRLRAKLP
jgi:hypothetical protein